MMRLTSRAPSLGAAPVCSSISKRPNLTCVTFLKLKSKVIEHKVEWHNIQEIPLVGPNEVLFPPLHIKVGLMKNIVKALDRDGPTFKFLEEMFPQLSETKLRAGIFTGPQIRQLLKDIKFEIQLHEKEKNAWCSFKAVCEQFLGDRRSPHYHLLVENLIKSYEGLGARMSKKREFLVRSSWILSW